MTFKDRHALETLPARIATLEAEAARLTAVLEDADLYTRNPARFAEVTAALESARQDVGRGGRTVAGTGDAARGTGAVVFAGALRGDDRLGCWEAYVCRCLPANTGLAGRLKVLTLRH